MYPIKDRRPDFRDFLTTLSGTSLIFCNELLVPPPEFRLLGGPPSDFLRNGRFTESDKENKRGSFTAITSSESELRALSFCLAGKKLEKNHSCIFKGEE